MRFYMKDILSRVWNLYNAILNYVQEEEIKEVPNENRILNFKFRKKK